MHAESYPGRWQAWAGSGEPEPEEVTHEREEEPELGF